MANYARVAKNIEALIGGLRMGGKLQIAEESQRIKQELEAQMQAEEELLLGRFAKVNANEAARLEVEHDSIRTALERINGASEGKRSATESAEQLLGLVRSHADREEVMLFPWAERYLLTSVWIQATRRLNPRASPGSR